VRAILSNVFIVMRVGLGVVIKIDFFHLRFLVVDDNIHMRKIVRALLNGFGARDVIEAEDGATGLEAFQNNAPDIVILDWMMPIVDGIELTMLIRNPKSSVNPYVPIIMLTAHSDKRRVLQARDCGVTEFLCKPISAKALHQRILNMIVNPRPFIKTKSYFGPDRRRFVSPSHRSIERREGKIEHQKIETKDLLSRFGKTKEAINR